jgi:hypothetical protein
VDRDVQEILADLNENADMALPADQDSDEEESIQPQGISKRAQKRVSTNTLTCSRSLYSGLVRRKLGRNKSNTRGQSRKR